jgi:transposase
MAGELRPLRDAGQAGLKALSARRRQLTGSIAIEKTRLKQAFDPLILDSSREMIARLENRRRAIEAELDRRILSSRPGIAAPISTLVAIEMPELGEIGRKEAAGLAPHPSQSGLSLGRNAISGGRPCLRAAFTMAALVAVRSHPRFKQIYLDLRAAGKPAKVALEWSASQTPSSATTSLSIKKTSLDPPNTVARLCRGLAGCPLRMDAGTASRPATNSGSLACSRDSI